MTSGHGFFLCEGFNLKSAPGTLFSFNNAAGQAAFTGVRFIPLNIFAVLRTMTGAALTTAPAVRIGTNVAHNNVAPIFTVPLGITVGTIGELPKAAPLKAPALDTAEMFLELTTAAVGPTTMTADVLVYGLVLG